MYKLSFYVFNCPFDWCYVRDLTFPVIDIILGIYYPLQWYYSSDVIIRLTDISSGI